MRKWKHILLSKRFLVCLSFCFIIYIFLNFLFEKKSIYSENDSFFRGIISEYKIDGNQLSFTLDTEEDLVVFYTIKSEEEKIEFLNAIGYGYLVEVTGVLNLPSENTIPNTFNYRRYLYYQHIHYTITADNIEITGNPKIWYKIKNYLTNYFKNIPNAGYFLAFILGETNDLDVETLRANGISHLFAVSGMHISLFVAIVEFIFRKHKKLTNSFLIVFLFFYTFLVGFTASVLRVVCQFYLKLFQRRFNLSLTTRQQIIVVMIFLLLIDPFWIMDIGFQYSFSISFFLTYLKPHKNYWISLLQVSLVAFLFSFPISSIHFYEINVFSILFNLFFVPYVSFLLYPCCLISVLFPLFLPILSFLISLFEIVNQFCLRITFGFFVIPKVACYWWLFYYFFAFFFVKTTKKKYLFWLLFVIFLLKNSCKLASVSNVYFLDVGQGDATLFVSSNQTEVILIDTGGKISYKKEAWLKREKVTEQASTLITFFHSLGISKLDYLILSHGDYDHMGESVKLVNNFKIEKVVFNNDNFNDLELELIEVLEEKNISYYQNIKEINIKNNNLYFLEHKLYDNENDNSNVIYTEIEGFKLLLMGDAGVKVEDDIVRKYNLSNIDILKIGHHGSKTSTSEEFIRIIHPKYSIISVGKNNRYGHPNEKVLENLKESTIYRTDVNGSVVFKIKNGKLKIDTCTS